MTGGAPDTGGRIHPRASGWRFAVLLLSLVLLHVSLLLYFLLVYVPGVTRETVEEWKDQLAVTADDRRVAIEEWVGERIADARIVAGFPTVVSVLSSPPEGGGRTAPGAEAREHLDTILDGFVRAPGYLGAAVIDREGNAVASSTAVVPLDAECLDAVRSVIGSGTPTVDLNLHSGEASSVLFVAPVAGRAGSVVQGAVVVSVDPSSWLYSLLRLEPGPSRVRDTVLIVKRRGESVYLTPSRQNSGTFVTRRRPDAAESAATEALEGDESFGSLRDYRGVEVFATARRIRNAPWALLVEVDRNEALAGVGREVRNTGLLGAALVLAGWGVAYGLWRDGRARYQRAVAKAETRFGALLGQARDIVLFFQPGGRIVDCNEAAVQAYGYARDEIPALDLGDLQAADSRFGLDDDLRRAATPEGMRHETVHRRKDGTTFPVEVNARGVESDGATVVVAVVRDISRRQQAEARIRRLNRLLRMISEVNELIVRESDRATLLSEACRIIVEHSGLVLAWIGLVEQSAGTVRPVASAGARAESYLSHVQVRADDSTLGRGPTGVATRENRTFVANDWEADERLAPWRETAREHGLRSSAALPLRVAGAVVGALSVYAAEANAFDAEVVGLLEELAADIGYSLGALDVEEKRQETERALRESEARYRLISRNAGDVIWTIDLSSRRFTYVSPSVQRLRGIPADDVVNQEVESAFTPESCRLLQADLADRLASFAAGNEAARIRGYEVEEVRVDGTIVPTEIVTTLLTDERGRVTALLGVSRDISERRKAEAALRLERDRARMYLDTAEVVLLALDREGRVTLINRKGCELLGWAENELLGRDWFATCVPERECGELRTSFARIMAGEIAVFTHMENSVVTRSGEERVVAWHNIEVRDESGTLIGTLSSGEDVTDRRRARGGAAGGA
jgi:PAS domain S-box-containing protein